MQLAVLTKYPFYIRKVLVGPLLKSRDTENNYRPPGYERVYLPLCKVADTPFHIQGDVL